MRKRILCLVLILSILSSLIVSWSITASAQTVASGTCGDDLTWVLDDEGTLTISGTGNMTNWTKVASVPWYYMRKSISTVIIENGVSTIGNLAFYNCSLNKIIISNSVTTIGIQAFNGCSSLSSITMPEKLTTIGDNAFSDCISLVNITIPASVTNIGVHAFYYCSSLTGIIVDENNTCYSNDVYGVLYNKDKTELIQYPKGSAQATFTIPNSVTTVDSYAFYSCKTLERIIVGNNVSTIGRCAFYSCSSLTNIFIPSKIATIEEEVFAHCSALSNVYYNGTEKTWNNISIGTGNETFTNATIHYNYSSTSTPKIKLGDYVQMGTYYGEPILWRCVAFEKISGYDDNGNPIMDATDTVTEYQEGYLPLMLSDKIICLKPFDAAGTNTSGSHGRGYYSEGSGFYRQFYGSDYWVDSNIRCWLNSKASAGNVVWTCGNPPVSAYNGYDDEAGFLTNFTSNELNVIKPVKQKSLLNGYEYSVGTSNVRNESYHIAHHSIGSVLQNYETAFSEQITDTMFLLDVKQVNEVYNNEEFLGDSYYVGKPTEKSIENSEYKNSELVTNKRWHYWLRSPYAKYYGSTVRYVYADGDINTLNGVSNSGYGVRPAFFLNTSNLQAMNGKGTETYPYTVGTKNITSTSNSTSSDAPVIKSAKLKYLGKTYDIINQSVNIGKGSIAWADITIDIEWNGTPNDKQKVYLTQGASTDEKNNIFEEYNALNNTASAVPIGTLFEADKPIYIMAVDESDAKNKSTAIATKINIIDTSGNEAFQNANYKHKFSLGQDIAFTIPDTVPVFGGTELTWKLDFIPITIKAEDGKMDLVFGMDLEEDGEFNFNSFKEDIDDYVDVLNKKANKQNRTLKQLRNDLRMSEANKTKNKGLTMSMWGNKVFKNSSSGEADTGIDVLGYAIAEIDKKGNLKLSEGYVCFEATVSYTYNGQVFIYVIPCYYTFGGSLGGKMDAKVMDLDFNTFSPKLQSQLSATLGAKIGGGIGVPSVAGFDATGKGDLTVTFDINNFEEEIKNYLKVTVGASAEFNLTILGQKVVSKDIWKLDAEDGIIYSTYPEDEDKSWIKPNSASLMSLNNMYDGYSADNVYESESRDYLANSMEWYGDMPPISLFAADYTNKNLTILADSVYPEAQPQIFSVGGTKVLVFTADNDTRTANNKQMLVYSVYNDEEGTWSNAIPVNDDGTADFYPSVSGEYLVWQNQKSVMGDGLSLAEIGKQGEIVIAKWNGNGFDAPVSLTDNDALDTLPKVGVNNNEISVVWIKNSANDILGVDGNTSIVKKVYNGSVWGEEVVLKNNLNAVTDLSVGYFENALNVAYVHDVDDDITTIDDREVYLIGSYEEQITDNKVLDSNAIINNGKLYWYSENNIHFVNLTDGTESTVFEDARYTLADGFTVSEDNGNIAILWSGSEDAGSEIKGVLYQDGAWGDVITVSELGAYAKYPTCVLEEDGTILTSFTAEADGITSLYTLGLFPSYDLAITDIYFDEKNLALNSENEFEVMVTNNGELPVEDYTINVYNEDETLNNSIVFEDAIKAGESKSVVGKFITGDAISYETLKVEIALNEDEEYVYDNNSITLSIGNGDISLESLSVYEMLPTSYAVADVKNIGYSDISNITVNLRKDSVDGEIVQSKTVSSLTAGSNEEVTFAYKPQDYENVKWYITIEVEANEVSVGNNHDYFINECAVGLEDYEISILNYSYADKQLTVNGYAKNNTNDSLAADAIFAVYSNDGRMKGITTQSLSVGGYSDTGIDVWFENYTYASGDYVKMFMWSDLTTTLRPMVNAEQVNIVIE